MPIIKSAIKRVKQSAKRRSHNLQVKRAIHQDVRAFTDALSSGDTKATTETLRAAISEIDRAVKKGTIHRNTASRRKSRLQKQANNVEAAPKAKAKTATKKPAAAKSKTP
ncbi:MAG TPA: 30S ribosomal protein S20, partial [Candidatus Polarisedimenticolaceae bacterium]|nr:30S ribosomal protein S20 [Candidatus Polarisedimenticolaceae bacterium]